MIDWFCGRMLAKIFFNRKFLFFFCCFFRLPFLASWCFANSTKSHRSSWIFLLWMSNGVHITRHLPFKSRNIRCWSPMTDFFVSSLNSFVKFERQRCSSYLAIFVFTIYLCASVPICMFPTACCACNHERGFFFSAQSLRVLFNDSVRVMGSDITVHKFIFYLLVKCPSTKII